MNHSGSNAQARHDSVSSVDKRNSPQSDTRSTKDQDQDQDRDQDLHYTSFPSPSTASQRSTSLTLHSPNEESYHIQAQYARYTDAPPPHTEQQYQGKSEQEQTNMRISDYAKEISRIMGRQIVRDLNGAQAKAKARSGSVPGVK